MLKKQRVILLGSNSNLAKAFIQSKPSNIETLNLSRSKNSPIQFDLCNIRNFCITDFTPFDSAIFFAGITSISECEEHSTFCRSINVDATVKAIKILNNQGIRCLFLSSTCVFGNNDSLFEYSEKNPTTKYGLYKSEAEDLILENDMNSILRFTKIFSSEQSNILDKWYQDFNSSVNINAFSDLRVAPLHNSLVLNFFVNWISSNLSGIFHISPNTDISYFSLAERFLEHFRLDNSNCNIIPAECSSTNKILYKPEKAYLNTSQNASISVALDDSLQNIFDEFLIKNSRNELKNNPKRV